MPVVVSIGVDAELSDVIARLRTLGLVVDRVLDPLGVVVGSVDPDRLAALGTVPGVSGVERQRTVGPA